MSGFEFGDGDDEAAGDGADADAREVAAATAEPLDDLGSHTDAHPPASDGSEAFVDALLYAGEEERASVAVANGRLVATSHRLLAYAPDADERATLRSVHRVNVADVSPSSTAADRLIRPTAYALVGGLAMVAAGSLVPFDSMNAGTPGAAGATGIGGLLSTIGGLLSVLAVVDDALRVVGAVALLVGAALSGLYAYTRSNEVVVETEGEAETLRVDAGDADAAAVEEFRSEAGFDDLADEESGFLGR